MKSTDTYFYTLASDGRTPVPCTDAIEWANWFAYTDHSIVKTETFGMVMVSTVFLGIDQGLGNGPPILWETMIFGGPFDQWQERACSYEQAIAQHAEAVSIAKGEEETERDDRDRYNEDEHDR